MCLECIRRTENTILNGKVQYVLFDFRRHQHTIINPIFNRLLKWYRLMSKYSFLFKNHISFSAVKAHHAALKPLVIIKRVDILIQYDKKVATRGK